MINKAISKLVTYTLLLISQHKTTWVINVIVPRTNEMATKLSKVLRYPFIYKVAVKTNQEIPDMVVMFPDDDVGIRAMVRAA